MKKILIFLGVILVLIVGSFIWYDSNLKSVSKESENVNFVIEKGSSKKQIIASLKEANLIKNETVALIYTKLNANLSFKAGTFLLNRNMDVKTILNALTESKSGGNTVKLTFKEGVRLTSFVNQIAEKLELNEEDLLKEINSKEFLEPLIKEYWFLTDKILTDGIYYPLEGYLYPNTYEVYKTANLKDIVKKMLDETNKELDPLKIQISESNYDIHDIITMASIIEKEAVKEEDRYKVSQVIYKRLETGMSLGMDVTSYYGAKKEMTDVITQAELDDPNPYNTRLTSFKGLPIGPICNPSKSSVKSALNPSDTNYTYFYADIKTGNVYFTNDYNEFLAFKQIYG